MEFDIYQVDSFTSDVFKGNPAAVVPLKEWLQDDTLQKIALENNLSETAFFIPTEKGFHLRWFTPTVEVDLCGHATLAASWVVFNELGYTAPQIDFESLSGTLTVKRSGQGLTMDFPVWEPKKAALDKKVEDALGAKVIELFHGPDWVAVMENESAVRNLQPDMARLSEIKEARGVIATAKGSGDTDFVSRFFGPRVGVPEDPVTGSAHCILTPIWSEKLGKTSLKAKQVSARCGELACELKGSRVEITGKAALYMKGKIFL